MTTLRDIGEDALIARLTAVCPLPDDGPGAAPGDDCAVVDPGPEHDRVQLLKTDALVEGVHFLPTADPRAVGWKAVARVISDFAAMGGRPERFLVTLALPAATRLDWAVALYQGMADCLRTFGAVLAGGETSRVPDGSAAVIAVAATGSASREHLVLRSTGRPGDLLLVTGTLGGSQAGRHLDFVPRLREALWLTAHHKPTAMMDLSDGLAKDLPRLAAASACGFRIDPDKLPRSPGCDAARALNDGEDFELLIALAPDQAAQLLETWPHEFPETPLTKIGKLVSPATGQQLDGGWDHFARVIGG